MLRRSSADFLSQLLTFIQSCATPSYPVDINVPRIRHILEDIATSTPEREDVARWLLDFGAKMQEKLPRRVTESSLDHPRSDLGSDHFNTSLLFTILQKAAQSGNRKIVRLLLERRVDPVSAQLADYEHSVKSAI